jgi:hypothetical protein
LWKERKNYMTDSYSEQLAAERALENTYYSRIEPSDTAELRKVLEKCREWNKRHGNWSQEMEDLVNAALAAQPSRGVSGTTVEDRTSMVTAPVLNAGDMDGQSLIDMNNLAVGYGVPNYQPGMPFKSHTGATPDEAPQHVGGYRIPNTEALLRRWEGHYGPPQPKLSKDVLQHAKNYCAVELEAALRMDGALAESQNSATLVEKKAVQPAGERERLREALIDSANHIHSSHSTLGALSQCASVICKRNVAALAAPTSTGEGK